jgi:flagellar biogenesis protein FliO
MRYILFLLLNFLWLPPIFCEEAAIIERSNYLEEVTNMIISLVVLLIFAVTVLFFVKKMMRSKQRFLNRSTAIKVLERRAFHSKASLYLVDILGKGVVIAESQGNIQLITEFPEGTNLYALMDLEKESQNSKISFKEMMQEKFSRFLKKPNDSK